MNNVIQLIKTRRSVRTYDEKNLSQDEKDALMNFAKTIDNPYGLPVCFKMMSAKENALSCPVVSGTDLYIGAKIKNTKHLNEAFGYSFEAFVLYAQSLGIGTVWLGGTMNREAYERAMELEDDEVMPCASALGYTAKKMSLREAIMRKGVKADERKNFEELFFDTDFSTPLTKEKAGSLLLPLEMVRLAPSAVNKQPWRVIICENKAHFYLQRNKAVSPGAAIDMQKVDMGIALCHFEFTAKENGLKLSFEVNDPGISCAENSEYIASYTVC